METWILSLHLKTENMKQLTHSFSGEVKTLDFGVMYYLKYLGEYTKGDPFTITGDEVQNPAKVFHYCAGLVYSGINAFNKLNKLPLITIEDAEDMVGRFTDDEATSFIKGYTALQLVGEVEPGGSPSPGTN